MISRRAIMIMIMIIITMRVLGDLGPSDLGPGAYIAILSLQSGDLGPRAQCWGLNRLEPF